MQQILLKLNFKIILSISCNKIFLIIFTFIHYTKFPQTNLKLKRIFFKKNNLIMPLKNIPTMNHQLIKSMNKSHNLKKQKLLM